MQSYRLVFLVSLNLPTLVKNKNNIWSMCVCLVYVFALKHTDILLANDYRRFQCDEPEEWMSYMPVRDAVIHTQKLHISRGGAVAGTFAGSFTLCACVFSK